MRGNRQRPSRPHLSWAPGLHAKPPSSTCCLRSNPAVDTSYASLLSHPLSPSSWLMISLSFDVLMKSLRLQLNGRLIVGNLFNQRKWIGNVTRVICLVNERFTCVSSTWMLITQVEAERFGKKCLHVVIY